MARKTCPCQPAVRDKRSTRQSRCSAVPSTRTFVAVVPALATARLNHDQDRFPGHVRELFIDRLAGQQANAAIALILQRNRCAVEKKRARRVSLFVQGSLTRHVRLPHEVRVTSRDSRRTEAAINAKDCIQLGCREPFRQTKLSPIIGYCWLGVATGPKRTSCSQAPGFFQSRIYSLAGL